MKKFIRTPLERKLLDMLKEINADITFVKTKNDAQSHRNKMILKSKAKIVQNELNKFRRTRKVKVAADASYPLTTVNMKYFRKIQSLIQNFSLDDEVYYFIKMSKKDIKKGRLTVKNLKKVLTYLGDNTWFNEDFPDTINKIRNQESCGIDFTTYKSLNKKTLPDNYISISNIIHTSKGEYVDVPEVNVEFYEYEKDITVISLKKFLKLI
jgi:hypothetical protein